MKNATFYLLNQNTFSDGMTSVEWLACELATDKWREGKRVLIACENDIQAFRMDEALWSHDFDAFVPHNLVGEGPRLGAPVEICWPQRRSDAPRDLLISLLSICVDFFFAFHEVIDFVPNENILKQLARDRYKAYRSFNFQLNTISLLGQQLTKHNG